MYDPCSYCDVNDAKVNRTVCMASWECCGHAFQFCVGFAHTKLSFALDDFLNFLHRDHSVAATGVLIITKNNRWFITIPPPCETICLSLSGQSP